MASTSTWSGRPPGNRWNGDYRFLHESFAEYTTWRGLGVVGGEHVRTAGSRMNAVWYMYRRPGAQDVPVLDPQINASPVWVYSVYHKGSTVLRSFEEAAGEKRFTSALRAMLKSGYVGLSVKGFYDALKQLGFDGKSMVEQWLWRTGYPRVTIHTEVSTTSSNEFEVALRTETSDGYQLQLPVVLVDSAGRRTDKTLDLAAGAGTVRFRLPTHPVVVEVDPRWTAVREVAPQLRGDVSMDGRVDAVDLIEVALRHGGRLPTERRVDGAYDPLYDVDGDRVIGDKDLAAVVAAATP